MSTRYKVGQRLYRAGVRGEPGYPSPGSIYYTEHIVVVTTPQGAWTSLTMRVDDGGEEGKVWGAEHRKDKWLGDSTRYAQATKGEALQALLQRKRSHAGHATRRQEQAVFELRTVRDALSLGPDKQGMSRLLEGQGT